MNIILIFSFSSSGSGVGGFESFFDFINGGSIKTIIIIKKLN